MKKYKIYVVIFAVGLILGWLIFGVSSKIKITSEESQSEKVSIWTCSMHPQIRQSEPGDCPICGMDLIPLEVNGNDNPLVFEMTEQAMKIAQIQTTIIGKAERNSTGLKLSGKLMANETNSASIVTHISGRIEKLFVSFTGEKVSKGQKIASIYSPKLITAQRELLEANKVKAVNPKLFEAAVNKLRFWKISENQIHSILNSKRVIESFNIYAGFSGIVLNKKVSVGDYLNEGAALFDIQNLSQLWVVLDVYESELASVKVGDKINFTTVAIPDKVYSSVINFVDPVINPDTRTATVRASITNANQLLKPEMFVEAVVQGESIKKHNIRIPKTAVLWTGERSVVYVKLPDLVAPSFEFREVVLGKSLGKEYQIISGLKEGEEVVTYGAFVIDASAQLNNQASMMNRLAKTSKNNAASNKFGMKNETYQVPAEFQQQIEQLIKAYLPLKDALIADNTRLAQKQAKGIVVVLKRVNMKLLSDQAHLHWMQQFKTILNEAEKLEQSNEIKAQRGHFYNLSQELIKSAQVFGVNEGQYFVQYCPMAKNDKGASWLSKEEEILNPYFGDAMLTCGSVIDTISKKTTTHQQKNNSNNSKQHNH